MKRIATHTARLLLAAVVGLGMMTLPALAQDAEPLGDEFIFFVEGVNPEVPSSSVSTVADPVDAENSVLAFGGGNFANPSLTWPAETGADISQNQADGDTLFLRMRVDPNVYTDTDTANVYIMLLDSQQLNNNGDPGDDDIAFRAIWPLPDSLFDNEWHDLVIPLPPATTTELDAVDPAANPVVANWRYQGGFNPDGNLFVTPGTDFFEEFDWSAVFSFGLFWDQSGGPGGTVFVDDWYIGSVNTDLSGFTGVGDPYAGTVTAEQTSDAEVTVSFTPQDGAAGYRVYLVDEEGADVTDPEQAKLIQRFAGDADDLSLAYKAFSPHPIFSSPTLSFAVTSENQAGIENTTPVFATATLEDAPPQGYVYQMSADEVDGLFQAFTNQVLSADFLELEDKVPFRMGPDEGTAADTEGDNAITEPEDLTVDIYMAWAPDPEAPDETIIMVYADVTDDAIFFDADNGEGAPSSSEPFLFDRIGLFFGTYPVAFPIGSPHSGIEEGDVTLNFQPVVDESGNVTVWPSAADSDLFSTPLFAYKEDGSGNRIGYEILAAFLMSDLGTEEEPVTFTQPEPTEVIYHPLIFAYDEQDGTGGFGTRTSVVNSEYVNVNFANPGWFASAAQWPATAFAGPDVGVSTETGDVPDGFALAQNYPNPFNPSTTIAFTLQEPVDVQLSVYNALGQRVATLVDGQRMTAGTHRVDFDATALTSGVYFYRIEAGAYRSVRQMVLLK